MKLRLKKTTILFILFVLIFISCDKWYNFRIVGCYYLYKAENMDGDISVSYRSDNGFYTDVVKQVFAVGFNNKYIIAKQHPSNNKTITNYFIVPIYKEFTQFPENGVIGPLTLEQFNEKRMELQISDNVKFTIDNEKKRIL